MKTNATESKSVHAPKSKATKPTPAEGGAPKVALAGGAVAVLPNPAEAPAPPKASKRKPAPTVVIRGARPEAAAKPAQAPAPAPKAAAGTLRAIGDGWLGSLEAAGHTKSTLASYRMDLAIAYEHLGGDVAAGSVNEKQIAAFEVSPGVTKKANGKPKAQPTILKTRRALRLALTWAAEKKLITKAPYPTK